MKVGDLVFAPASYGSTHIGLVLDLYDEKNEGEAQILWDDGKILWEIMSYLGIVK